MNTFVDICLSPFQEFLFMRHALVAPWRWGVGRWACYLCFVA